MIRGAVLLAAVVALLGASTANAAFPPIDLSAAGATVTSTVDGTIWTNTNLIQSAGTGVIDPFLRWQKNDTEMGMNTDAKSPPYDTKAGIWTHSLTYGQLGIVNKGGIDYYVFTLDINESAGGVDPFLTLDQVRIYSTDASAGGALADEGAVQAASGSTLHYSLDATQDQTIYMNYSVSNTGSGESDVDFYIPTSFFAGATSDDFLYMVVNAGMAGSTDGLDSSDGFEEVYAFLGTSSSSSSTSSTTSSTTSSSTSSTTTSTVPEPGTIALFGMGLIGLAAARRKK
jgi:hypothetical protein